MSHGKDPPTPPRTSFSSTHETNVAALCKQLRSAVAKTVDGLDESIERQIRCFLSRGELDQILTTRALEDLYRELILGANIAAIAPTISQAAFDNSAEKEKDRHPSNIDRIIESYVRKTTGTPSRKALLALFLYQHREELLSRFLDWLRSDNSFIPSDESMPFTEAELNRLEIPFWCQQSILIEQAIFKPVTIQKLKHHQFKSDQRLPFVGRQIPIKEGSSGNVVKTEIAQYHWDMENDDEIIPGNPNNTAVVALKIFKKGVDGSMEEATRDFNIELAILKQLRSCKTQHGSIMLDWGSITIKDHQGNAISHSLIFKLATFSLEDLLKDGARANKYLRKSLLLRSLVDVVEALECLHDKVEALHFDIKPENILIFENSSSNSATNDRSCYELTWKLSDFGLARKKTESQRASIVSGSTTPSVASTLPATRPPGLYQAPEIQQQNVSQAGQGSDVWSMGIVALMVLAYMSNGPKEVSELKTLLNVHFPGGGKEPLTYVRTDQRIWKHRKDHKFCYLSNRIPEPGDIPGTAPQLRATLNPKLIEWSNNLLLGTYELRTEQDFVKKILQVIFGRVLLIDRGKRMSASNLRSELAKIEKIWALNDANPEPYKQRDNLANPSYPESHSSQEASQGESSGEASMSNPSERTEYHDHGQNLGSTPSIVVTEHRTLVPESPVKIGTTRQPSSRDHRIKAQDERPLVVRRDSMKSQTERFEVVTTEPPHQSILTQESLCSAIQRNDRENVRRILQSDCDKLSQICPGVKRLPIHWALFKNAYDALDVLLEYSTKEITNLVCNRRTALDLACEQGKPTALDCIRKHREKFDFPRDIYQKRYERLGSEAKSIMDDLFDINRVTSPKEKKFFIFRSRKPNLPG